MTRPEDDAPYPVELNYLPTGYDLSDITYSDGTSAVFAQRDENVQERDTSAESTQVEAPSWDVLQAMMPPHASGLPITFPHREDGGYDVNVVDSYIHHLHTLLHHYVRLLKASEADPSEVAAGLSTYRPTRVDALLDELRYTKKLVAYFRELLEAQKGHDESNDT